MNFDVKVSKIVFMRDCTNTRDSLKSKLRHAIIKVITFGAVLLTVLPSDARSLSRFSLVEPPYYLLFRRCLDLGGLLA